MTQIGWDETNPSADDPLSELGAVWRSFKTNMRGAFEQHFYLNASSTSTGQAIASATTPGSCRAYYGPRSQVSFPQRTGTLMVVSDESRLLAFGSAGSVIVGSARMLHSFSGTANAQNVVHLVDSGSLSASEGANDVAFSSAFSVATKGPVTVTLAPAAAAGAFTLAAYNVGSSGFSVWRTFEGIVDPGCSVYWRSTATALL